MLTDLVDQLIVNSALREEFARDPAPLFERFGLNETEVAWLRTGDEVRLSMGLGQERFLQFRQVVPPTRLDLYPGVAPLEITSASAMETQQPGFYDLRISVTWTEVHVTPEDGLPSWVIVQVFDSEGREVGADRLGSHTVPVVLDFRRATAELSRKLPLSPGKYRVVVDATSREVLPSQAVEFDVA